MLTFWATHRGRRRSRSQSHRVWMWCQFLFDEKKKQDKNNSIISMGSQQTERDNDQNNKKTKIRFIHTHNCSSPPAPTQNTNTNTHARTQEHKPWQICLALRVIYVSDAHSITPRPHSASLSSYLYNPAAEQQRHMCLVGCALHTPIHTQHHTHPLSSPIPIQSSSRVLAPGFAEALQQWHMRLALGVMYVHSYAHRVYRCQHQWLHCLNRCGER